MLQLGEGESTASRARELAQRVETVDGAVQMNEEHLERSHTTIEA
jgi:hypothetical protein